MLVVPRRPGRTGQPGETESGMHVEDDCSQEGGSDRPENDRARLEQLTVAVEGRRSPEHQQVAKHVPGDEPDENHTGRRHDNLLPYGGTVE